MAAFHGKGGSASFSGLTPITLTSWSVTATAEISEATAMGDTWKSYLTGYKDWTATAECLLDGTGPDIGVLGSSATLTLTAASSGNHYYSGTAICTNIGSSADKGDVAKVSYQFQGSGTLAVTTN